MLDLRQFFIRLQFDIGKCRMIIDINAVHCAANARVPSHRTEFPSLFVRIIIVKLCNEKEREKNKYFIANLL